jgi:hypothetical protein
MTVATRNTANVELIHARRGTANPPVHTEHALHPGSLFVGAGLGAERCKPTTVIGSVGRRLHLHRCRDLLGSPSSSPAAGSFSLSTPTNT